MTTVTVAQAQAEQARTNDIIGDAAYKVYVTELRVAHLANEAAVQAAWDKYTAVIDTLEGYCEIPF